MYVRPSLLPIAQYCPQAVRLSGQYGAGRAAAKSKAFHALLAGSPESRRLMLALSPDEREEIETWHRPTTCVIDGVTLDYASAAKEVPVGLSKAGGFLDPSTPEDDPRFLTKGTLDFAWIADVWGMHVAFVADLKKSSFTTTDGPESLQLHCYATAFAERFMCDAYVTGLWILEDGEWQWSADEPVELGTPRHSEILETIVHAATNTEGEACTGRHCLDCWNRKHCPEYLAPAGIAALAANGAPLTLDAITRPGGITADNAASFLVARAALEDLADIISVQVKTFVANGGTVRDGRGKVYSRSVQKGRESANVNGVKALLNELPADLANRYSAVVSRGNPFEVYRWVNEKGKKR